MHKSVNVWDTRATVSRQMVTGTSYKYRSCIKIMLSMNLCGLSMSESGECTSSITCQTRVVSFSSLADEVHVLTAAAAVVAVAAELSSQSRCN